MTNLKHKETGEIYKIVDKFSSDGNRYYEITDPRGKLTNIDVATLEAEFIYTESPYIRWQTNEIKLF